MFLFFSKNNDSTATIPSSICIISSDASIKTLKKIEIIESYAFSGTSIKQISIPKTVKKNHKGEFSNCGILEEIKISPDSQLQDIDEEAFISTSLRSFTFSKVYKVRQNKVVFLGVLDSKKLFLPDSEAKKNH